jgi:hypothetical protein
LRVFGQPRALFGFGRFRPVMLYPEPEHDRSSPRRSIRH